MHRDKQSIAGLPTLFLLTLVLCFALQVFLILMHEYAHSTTAWLLGYIPTPRTVVWGNLFTQRGWDEGVPYDRLFPVGGRAAEAAVGGMPLLMHTLFVAVGLYFVQRRSKPSLAFYAVYWFVVTNVTELIAYIWMRPWIPTGDTGRFNAGLRLSPWLLFLAGTAVILYALVVLYRSGMATVDRFVHGNGTQHTFVVWWTAFILFAWGSGLRILSMYPDPQWRWGLVGAVGFVAWIVADRFRRSKPGIG